MLLGQMLIRDFSISETDVQRGLEFQKQYGGRLGEILINMGGDFRECPVDRVIGATRM